MGMDMSKKPPLNPNHNPNSNQTQNPTTKNLFPSPALFLSLAGIFRHGGGTSKNYTDVEEGDEANGGGSSRKRGDITEISSENSALRRSYDNITADQDDDDDDADENKKKKREKYHRHTLDQIREMEALFKESPHPDEKQRQELSKKLGLHPRQVKFLFLNRRTQI